MSNSTGKAKHVFISDAEIIKALGFSYAPSLLGECEQTKKEVEQYLFTDCYDSDGAFIGYAIEKGVLKQ
jgi:hypothetical protein